MTALPLNDPLASPPDDPRLWLCALADGDVQAADKACSLWRDDAQARQAWHAYHLIGDVLRSDELAVSPARDAAFLAGVRARLVVEPVVLAPTVLPRRRQPWLVPAAMAAGFAVVASVVVVSRGGLPAAQPTSPGYAAAAKAGRGGATMVSSPLRAAPLAGQEGSIRDARLNEYLRAHEAARGGVAMVAPGGMLHRVDAVVPASPER